jgi:hypothetical membrane protein
MLVKKHGHFDFKRQTYSEIGDKKNIGRWFNLALIIFSVNQVIFSLQVSQKISDNSAIFFLIGGVFLCLTGLFTTGKHPWLHSVTAILCALLVSAGVLITIYNYYPINITISSLALLATLLMPISYLLRKRFPGAQWETMLFACIAVWNVCFSFAII